MIDFYKNHNHTFLTMKTTKTITHTLTLKEVKKSLAGYNGDMLLELLAVKYPGTGNGEVSFGRKAMRDFALLASDGEKLEEEMENAGICWISVPETLIGWTDVIAAFPGVFFGCDELDTIAKEQEDPDTKVEVVLEGRRVDIEDMVGNV